MAKDLFANDNTTNAPRTDYTKLVHNGKQYDTLEVMVHQIARERSNVAFKSTKLILAELPAKAKTAVYTDQEVADAMINANIKMIMSYIKEKADSRGLFGL